MISFFSCLLWGVLNNFLFYTIYKHQGILLDGVHLYNRPLSSPLGHYVCKFLPLSICRYGKHGLLVFFELFILNPTLFGKCNFPMSHPVRRSVCRSVGWMVCWSVGCKSIFAKRSGSFIFSMLLSDYRRPWLETNKQRMYAHIHMSNHLSLAL